MSRRLAQFLVGTVAVSLLGLAFSLTANAASLDPNFGSNGTVIYRHGGTLEHASSLVDYTGRVSAMTEDREGRIIVGGGSGAYLLVQRYLSSGRLDPTFGIDGTVRLEELYRSGLPDYSPDPSEVAPVVKAIGTTRSGKVILATETGEFFSSQPIFRETIMQLNEDGTLDPSFGDRAGGILGLTQSNPRSVAVIPRGGFYTGGETKSSVHGGGGQVYSGYISRRSAYGHLFEAFGELRLEPGVRHFIPAKPPRFSSVSKVMRYRSGKVLVGGYDRNRFFLSKLDSSGRPWKRFGNAAPGKSVLHFGGRNCRCVVTGGDFALDKRGRIVQVGFSDYPRGQQTTIALARYKTNGHLDKRFGRRGFSRVTVRPRAYSRAIAIQRNGKIVVAAWKGGPGFSKFLVLRFLASGKPDRKFFNRGRYTADIGIDSTADKVLIDMKGRIVVAGGAAINNEGSFVIKRFLPWKKSPGGK